MINAQTMERHNEVKKKRAFISSEQFQLQTLIWPGIILCFIFSYIPMYGIIIAFKDYNILSTISSAQWVGLKYFQEFFTDPALGNEQDKT